MDWDAYTVFSVVSGILLVIFGITVSVNGKDRAWVIGGGVFFLLYGFYVAAQTSGTFGFPVIIFLIPFGAIAYLIYKRWQKSRT